MTACDSPVKAVFFCGEYLVTIGLLGAVRLIRQRLPLGFDAPRQESDSDQIADRSESHWNAECL